MTTNTEEETKPPEIAEILWLDGSVGRALENQFKVVGFNSLPGVILTWYHFWGWITKNQCKINISPVSPRNKNLWLSKYDSCRSVTLPQFCWVHRQLTTAHTVSVRSLTHTVPQWHSLTLITNWATHEHLTGILWHAVVSHWVMSKDISLWNFIRRILKFIERIKWGPMSL